MTYRKKTIEGSWDFVHFGGLFGLFHSVVWKNVAMPFQFKKQSVTFLGCSILKQCCSLKWGRLCWKHVVVPIAHNISIRLTGKWKAVKNCTHEKRVSDEIGWIIPCCFKLVPCLQNSRGGWEGSSEMACGTCPDGLCFCLKVWCHTQSCWNSAASPRSGSLFILRWLIALLGVNTSGANSSPFHLCYSHSCILQSCLNRLVFFSSSAYGLMPCHWVDVAHSLTLPREDEANTVKESD